MVLDLVAGGLFAFAGRPFVTGCVSAPRLARRIVPTIARLISPSIARQIGLWEW